MTEFFQSPVGIVLMKIIYVLLILAVSGIAIKLFKRMTKNAVAKSKAEGNMRAGTILTICNSTIKYVIYFIAFAAIMSTFGVNIAPIIASAGVVGVAVAFGAQSLVKDVITGIFIMLEDSYSVGDYVKAGGVSGFVTEVGLRSTKIRDWTNEVHIVPNGNIAVITNYSKENLNCFIDIPLAYAENANIAIGIMQSALDKFNADYAEQAPDAKILGLNSFENNRMLIKVCLTADADAQAGLERACRLYCKNAFDEAGIMMPASYTMISEQRVLD